MSPATPSRGPADASRRRADEPEFFTIQERTRVDQRTKEGTQAAAASSQENEYLYPQAAKGHRFERQVIADKIRALTPGCEVIIARLDLEKR